MLGVALIGCFVMCCCSFSKPIPNLSKSSQAPAKPNKMDQRKRLGFAWILLSELGLFNGLQRPPGQEILSLLLSRPWPSQPWLGFSRRSRQGSTDSDFRKEKSHFGDKGSVFKEAPIHLSGFMESVNSLLGRQFQGLDELGAPHRRVHCQRFRARVPADDEVRFPQSRPGILMLQK